MQWLSRWWNTAAMLKLEPIRRWLQWWRDGVAQRWHWEYSFKSSGKLFALAMGSCRQDDEDNAACTVLALDVPLSQLHVSVEIIYELRRRTCSWSWLAMLPIVAQRLLPVPRPSRRGIDSGPSTVTNKLMDIIVLRHDEHGDIWYD